MENFPSEPCGLLLQVITTTREGSIQLPVVRETVPYYPSGPQPSYLWCVWGVKHIRKGLCFKLSSVMCFAIYLLAFPFVCLWVFSFVLLCYSWFYKSVTTLTSAEGAWSTLFPSFFSGNDSSPFFSHWIYLQIFILSASRWFLSLLDEVDTVLVLIIIFQVESVTKIVLPCYPYVYKTDQSPADDSFPNVFFKHMMLIFWKVFLSENSWLHSYRAVEV